MFLRDILWFDLEICFLEKIEKTEKFVISSSSLSLNHFMTGSGVVRSYGPIERTYPMPLNPLRPTYMGTNKIFHISIKSQFIHMKS